MNRGARDGLPRKVTRQQRPAGSKAAIWEESISGSRNGKCKGPEARDWQGG